MPVYRYDNKGVATKISDRVHLRPSGEGKTFRQKVMEGYSRQESRGNFRSAHSTASIKRIWGC